MKWMSYTEASALVCSLGIQTIEELKVFCKSDRRPENFPRSAGNCGDVVGWKGEWQGIPAFLCRKKIVHPKRAWRAFKEAKVWAQSLGLKDEAEWHLYCDTHEIPKDIPKAPGTRMYLEWDGYYDWLVHSIATYEEVKVLAHEMGIKGRKHYRWCYAHGKLPDWYPGLPEAYFTQQGTWVSWADLTGSEHDRGDYLSYEEARVVARTLGLMSEGYLEAGKKGELPERMPPNPSGYYGRKGQWNGWGDYLGETRKDRYREQLETARPLVLALVKKHLIVSERGLADKLKEMKAAGEDISMYLVSPEGVDIHEWLGTEEVVEELVKRVRLLEVGSDADWNRRVRQGEVDLVVQHPLQFYRSFGYEGKFLFGDTWEPEIVVPKIEMLTYVEALPLAQEFARANGITKVEQWSKSKRPQGLPCHPETKYKGNGWDGWKIWLGIPKIEIREVDVSRAMIMQLDIRNREVNTGKEQWKPVSFIQGYEASQGYWVSTHGRVRWGQKGELEQREVGSHPTCKHLCVYLYGRKGVALVHRIFALGRGEKQKLP